jgi:hypothetical protein
LELYRLQFQSGYPRNVLIYSPKTDLRLNLTISSFKSRTRRPYATPSATEVANLKASLRGVTYMKHVPSPLKGLLGPGSTCKHFTQKDSGLECLLLAIIQHSLPIHRHVLKLFRKDIRVDMISLLVISELMIIFTLRHLLQKSPYGEVTPRFPEDRISCLEYVRGSTKKETCHATDATTNLGLLE